MHLKYRIGFPRRTTVVAVALLVSLAACPTQAQVAITGVAGTPVEGQSLTVSGSGFGEKAKGPPVIWDRIDNIPAYAGLPSGAQAPVQSDGCADCPWTNHIPESWGNPPVIHRDPADLRVSGRPVYSVGQKGFFRGKDLGGSGATDLYLNWWVYTKYSLHNQGLGQVFNKVMRLWPDTEGTRGRTSWETDFVYYYDANLETHTANFPEALTPGRWHNIQAIIRSDADMTNGGGWLEFIVDNELVTIPDSEAIISDLGSQNGPYDTVWLIGSDPHIESRYRTDQEFFFGDIYVDLSLARVLIGNGATYSGCTHVEIQPVTSWGSEQIVIGNVNMGGLSGSDYWLYVFDADNRHNENGFYIGSAQDGPGQPGKPFVPN